MIEKTSNPKFYLPITRIDETERMVYGYGTREDLTDSYGTVIDLESVKRCMPDYLKWRNIREMHQPSAVGRADEITVDGVGVYLGVKVVDDNAWKKVKEKVYRGFSVGGKKDYQDDDRIYLKSITEFSLVDRPSNEGCAIDEFRIYGGESMAEETKEKTEKADEPDIKRYLGEEAYDAQTALSALTNIIYLLGKEKSEEHPEAAAQAADLKVVVEKLKSFIASEIQESDEEKGVGEMSTVSMSAGKENDTLRAGARNSKSDLERLQAIHDHTIDMGAACQRCDTEKGDNPDLTRMQTLEADVTRLDAEVKRLEGENTELRAEVERLKAQPEPAKGPLKDLGIDKAADTQRVDAEAQEIQRIESLPAEQQAVELIRMAQRKPMFIGLR